MTIRKDQKIREAYDKIPYSESTPVLEPVKTSNLSTELARKQEEAATARRVACVCRDCGDEHYRK